MNKSLLIFCSFMAMGFSVLAQSTPATVYVVASVPALRVGNFTSYPNLRLTGWNTLADGGEGDLVLDPSDTSTADNSCTVYVDSVGNRFKRMMENNAKNEINLYQCGAYGDGTHSDTAAIKNAINAVAAVGVPYGGNFGRIKCPAGVFLTSGNIIPAGQRIELVGEHVSGVAGCEIKASSTSIDVLTVNADAFKMDDVWIFGGNAVGAGNCLVLGSSSLTLNDTTISNSWVSNCSNAGISIINAQGVFINNTTVEISYTFGILASLTGSNIAQHITINGSTFYGNATAISIAGTGTGSSAKASAWNITGGTSFENNASPSTCSINIQQANSINISSNRFNNSSNHDVCANTVTNLVVNDNTWVSGGGAALNCTNCSGTTVNNNNGADMWLGYAVGFSASAVVSFTGTGSNNIAIGNNFSCNSPHAMFGLSTSTGTTNTGIGPNMFACDTTNAYNVLGTKAWNY